MMVCPGTWQFFCLSVFNLNLNAFRLDTHCAPPQRPHNSLLRSHTRKKKTSFTEHPTRHQALCTCWLIESFHQPQVSDPTVSLRKHRGSWKLANLPRSHNYNQQAINADLNSELPAFESPHYFHYTAGGRGPPETSW